MSATAVLAHARPGRDRLLFAHRDDSRTARDKLIAEKMPLAIGLARRYMGPRNEWEDLRQVAALGLIKAIDRFDPERGTAFSSFAVPTITGEIRRHIRDTSWAAHVTRDMQEASLEVVRASDDLTVSLGRSPTIAELADATGRTREVVIQALETTNALDADSLDAPLPGEGIASRHDSVGAPDMGLEAAESRATATSVIERLPAKERELLDMRFGEGLTQRQIGARLGVSQMHVSRLLRRALDRASILAAA
jgi:RNA polymerase sigma-B factor